LKACFASGDRLKALLWGFRGLGSGDLCWLGSEAWIERFRSSWKLRSSESTEFVRYEWPELTVDSFSLTFWKLSLIGSSELIATGVWSCLCSTI
jgi:hypothetical protein